MEKNIRLKWIDIAKGIAIIAMVFGHLNGLPKDLRHFIFSFHMPLFLMINGYFVRDYDIKKCVKKSFYSLLVPYFTICFIETLIDSCVYGVNIESFVNRLFRGLDNMIVGMSKQSDLMPKYGGVWLVWFLNMLFVSRILYVIICKFTEGKSRSFRYLAIFLVSVVGELIGTQIGYLPWSLDIAFYSTIFIMVGDKIYKSEILEWNRFDGESKPSSKGVYFLCLIFSVLLWIVVILSDNYIELAVRRYPYIYLGAIGAVGGSFSIMCLCRYLEKKGLFSSIIAWYGKNSLIVLFFHGIEMRFVNWKSLVFDKVFIFDNWYSKALFRFFIVTICTFIYVWIKNILLTIKRVNGFNIP